MDEDIFLSIIIPAYNEERRIKSTLKRISNYLTSNGYRYEIIVVDDGSTDGTFSLVKRMKGEIKGLRIIRSGKTYILVKKRI